MVHVLATKPEDLCWVPGTHTVEETNSSEDVHHGTRVPTCWGSLLVPARLLSPEIITLKLYESQHCLAY